MRSFSQRSCFNFNHGTYSTYAHKTPRNKNLLSHWNKIPFPHETKFRFSTGNLRLQVTSRNQILFLLETKIHFWITLLYKPQHSPGVQWYSSLCQQLDSALVAGHCDAALAVHLTLLSNCLVGLLANIDHILLGFYTAYSAHDVISQIPEVTSLQGFHHKVSNHLLGWTPPNADLLHVHLICTKKVSDVDMPRTLAAWSFTILL